MKKLFVLLFFYLHFLMTILFSCKNDHETLNIINAPPIANAGHDQTLVWPENKTILDGIGSSDQDQNIIRYIWNKISGPPAFEIVEVQSVRTSVTSLQLGTYQFELTVYDAGLLYSKDTVQVIVQENINTRPGTIDCNGNIRPQINAQLIPIGILSQKREDIEIASAGGKILFAGGYTGSRGGYTHYSTVDIYDIRKNSWSTDALSQAQSNLASTVYGHKIIFAGFKGIDIYDAASGTWNKKTLRVPRSDMAAATTGTKILFAGGIGEVFYSPHWQTSPIDIYDANTDTWSEFSIPANSTMSSIGLAGIAATTIGAKVYFTGNASDWFAWDFGSITASINIYDANNNSWSNSALSIPRGFMASIAVDNKIYWAGGLYKQPIEPFTDLVEIRDVNAGSSTFACLFQPNAFFTAVQKNDKIVFFTSGVNLPVYWPVDAPVMNKFDIYDISTNTWSIGVLPVNIHGSSVIAVDNIIYVAGGFVNGNLSSQVYKLEF